MPLDIGPKKRHEPEPGGLQIIFSEAVLSAGLEVMSLKAAAGDLDVGLYATDDVPRESSVEDDGTLDEEGMEKLRRLLDGPRGIKHDSPEVCRQHAAVNLINQAFAAAGGISENISYLIDGAFVFSNGGSLDGVRTSIEALDFVQEVRALG